MLSYYELLVNPVFIKLDTLQLLPNDHIIMGTGIMFALGIRDLNTLDDLDLFVSLKCWNRVKTMSQIIPDVEWHCEKIVLYENTIEIFNGWGPGSYNFDTLLKNSIRIGSFTFLSLNDLINWKKAMGRDKDKIHLQMIENYLNGNPTTNL